MQGLIQELARDWREVPVMLAPRNFKATQGRSAVENLVAFSRKLTKLNAQCYIDPQLFSCDKPHKNLGNFPHAIACAGDLGSNYAEVLQLVVDLNNAAGTKSIILPAGTTSHIDAEWSELCKRMVERASGLTSLELFLTIAVSSSVVRDSSSIARIIELVEVLPVSGIYLVMEHPSDAYMTDDTLWLVNALQLVASFKRSGKQVFVGYANQQQLITSVAHCDAIFTGNFMNTRSFQTKNFALQPDSGPSQRSVWYYAPLLYAEFRTVTLDLAKQSEEISHELFASPFSEARHFKMLFGEERTLPSQTAYNEKSSFENYLSSVRGQCQFLTRGSYEETREAYLGSLRTARILMEELKTLGVYDARRSFLPVVDACESAVNAFDAEMGFQMRLSWGSL